MTQILRVSTEMSDRVVLHPLENQVAICEPIVYLEAAVDGDLSRHLFEWEQISGTPIVDLQVTSPTQAYYTVPGLPGTDKVFRFYVDRGTRLEQYKDVVVRTTPVTEAKPIEVGELINANAFPDYSKVSYGRFVNLTPFDTITPGQPVASYEQTTALVQVPDPSMYYQTRDADMETYAARYAGVVVETWSGSTWNNVATVSPFQNAQLSLPLPFRLRVGALYRKTGSEDQVIYNDWRDFNGGYVCGHEPVKAFEAGELGAVSAVSRTVYGPQPLVNSENITTFEVGEIGCESTPVRIIWQVDVQNYSENISTFEVGELKTLFTVTRIAGGNLGG